MPRHACFRHLEEKHLPAVAELMSWSPKIDVIAVANVQGEVAVHRLSWQKVWVLAPPSEGLKVRALAWRPDGQVLSVGYSSGVILLCDTENMEILHSNEVNGSVCLLQWVAESKTPDGEESIPIFEDDASEFLPKLPPLSKTCTTAGRPIEELTEDSKKLGDRSQLNLLAIATEHGMLYLYAFGIFPCLEYSMDVGTVAGDKTFRFHSIALSNDFGLLTVTFETEAQLRLAMFELPLLASRKRELHAVAVKYAVLSSLLAYVEATLKSVAESWEDILLEIDSKLSKYATEKRQTGSGSVSDDFLELLMFGTTTDELQKFLMHDLTEKGLKKVGQSIELSYSNIQRLVLKHLQSVGQALVYHLTTLCGMAHWFDRFGVLGLSAERSERCVAAAGSFLLKATELQQVIDNSMRDFKAFFRWLYVVILRLSDEPIPAEINKITQQDLQFVARFLEENFSTGDPPADGFNLERVGQYLKNADLPYPPDLARNPWAAFLESHPALRDDSLLLPYPHKRSLVQQHELLKTEFEESLHQIARHVGQTLTPSQVVRLAHDQLPMAPRVRQQFVHSTGCLYAVFATSPAPCKTLTLLQYNRATEGEWRAVRVHYDELGLPEEDDESRSSDSEPKDLRHLILDFQFYNDDTLSVLVVANQKDGTPVLLQAPLKNLLDGGASFSARPAAAQRDPALELDPARVPEVNGGYCLANGGFHHLQGMTACEIAVSGARRVACITFASRRRIRLFEMDGEDEDEESSLLQDDLDNPNSSRETDTSATFLAPDGGRQADCEMGSDENKENFRLGSEAD